MTKSKSKPKAKPKAEPEELEEGPTTYILLSGKHSRRLSDGSSEMFYPGDEIPNPTAAELAAFGDKIVSAETFEIIAATHAQTKQAEARRKSARAKLKAEGSRLKPAKRDADAVQRGKVLEEIRNDDQAKKQIRM